MARMLTADEYETFTQEAEAQARWMAHALFATNVYGPQADKLVLTIFHGLCEEAVCIRTATALDAAGMALPFDTSTRWWRRHAEAYNGQWEDEWMRDVVAEAVANLPLPDPCDLTIEVLAKPPRTIQIESSDSY